MDKFLWIAFASIALTACGMGDMPKALPDKRPTGSANGYAVDALVVNANVAIYNWDTGTKGELLATSVTDDTGHYVVNINSPSATILVELSGGKYTEETGRVVTLTPTQRLRAVTHYRMGDAISVQITPWTNLAAGLAAYKVSRGRDVINAVTEANVAISSILGIDIIATYPRNITDPANAGAFDDERWYGAVAAGISKYVAWASTQNGPAGPIDVTSIQLAQTMYDDISTDGLLDGSKLVDGQSVALAVGSVALNANVYRAGVAAQIINAIGDPNTNKTGVSIPTVLSNAQKLAGSRSALFGSLVPVSLDNEPPVVTNKLADNAWVAGTVPYSATFSDFVGVASVEYDVDGVDIVKIADIERPTFLLNTKNYTDGPHKMGVRSKDLVGNEAYVQFPINFMNTGILATIESPLLTNKVSYNVYGKWVNNGPGISTITVKGNKATVKDDGTWNVTLDLNIGHNSVTVHTVDTLGNTTDRTSTIDVDTAPPVVSWGLSTDPTLATSGKTFFVNTDGTDYYEYFAYANTLNLPIKVYSDKISSGSTKFDPQNLNSAGLFNYIKWNAYDDGCHTINSPILCTDAGKLKITLSYVRGGDFSKPIRVTEIKPDANAWEVQGLTVAVTEFLDDLWHTFPATTKHTWRLTVTDLAGNSTDADFSFKADVRQTPTPVSIAINNFTQNVAWADRGTLYGKPQIIETLTYDNSNGSTHFFALDDNQSTFSATQLVETAIRENKYVTTTATTWQGQYLNNCSSSGCSISSWAPINSFGDCRDGSTYSPPSAVVSDPIDIKQDDIPVTATDTGWSNYDPLGADCDSGNSASPRLFIQYYVAGNVLRLQWKEKNVWGQWYTTWDSGIPRLQTHTTVVPSLVAGFPRENWSSYTETYGTATDATTSIFTRDFKVYLSDGTEIKPNKQGNKSWYRAYPGQILTIQRTILVPNISVHRDPEIEYSLSYETVVKSQPPYLVYSLQRADNNIVINGAVNPLKIYRAHVNDLALVDTMSHEPQEYCTVRTDPNDPTSTCASRAIAYALKRPARILLPANPPAGGGGPGIGGGGKGGGNTGGM